MTLGNYHGGCPAPLALSWHRAWRSIGRVNASESSSVLRPYRSICNGLPGPPPGPLWGWSSVVCLGSRVTKGYRDIGHPPVRRGSPCQSTPASYAKVPPAVIALAGVFVL